MIKKAFILSVLLLGLRAEMAHGQIYVSFVFTNTLASSSGSSSLLGIGLGQNTMVQGVFTCTVGNEGSKIELMLSDGINSVSESNSALTPGFSYTQDLVNHSIIFTGTSATPWGGLFQDVVYLPASVMSSDINSTLLNVLGGGKLGPGVTYDQYHSVVTISDGVAAGVFGVGAVPEPSSLVLSAMSGLVSFFVLRRRG